MKRNKKWLACITAGLFLLNATSAFAADRDVWDATTKTKYATRMEMRKDKSKILPVRRMPGKYYFELDGNLYSMKSVYKAFAQNKNEFLVLLKQETPEMKAPDATEDLEVLTIE